MIFDSIFQSGDFNDLRAGLEIAWRDQKEVDHNIVNAETPGFKAKNTDFKALLLNQGDGPPKGEAFQMYMEELEGPKPFDLEHELARLSRAGLENGAISRVLTRRYSDLRYVIREGR